MILLQQVYTSWSLSRTRPYTVSDLGTTLIYICTISYNTFIFITELIKEKTHIADTIPLKVYITYTWQGTFRYNKLIKRKHKQFKLKWSFMRFYSIKCLLSQLFFSHEWFHWVNENFHNISRTRPYTVSDLGTTLIYICTISYNTFIFITELCIIIMISCNIGLV
jgi:hypothetical protein